MSASCVLGVVANCMLIDETVLMVAPCAFPSIETEVCSGVEVEGDAYGH